MDIRAFFKPSNSASKPSTDKKRRDTKEEEVSPKDFFAATAKKKTNGASPVKKARREETKSASVPENKTPTIPANSTASPKKRTLEVDTVAHVSAARASPTRTSPRKKLQLEPVVHVSENNNSTPSPSKKKPRKSPTPKAGKKSCIIEPSLELESFDTTDDVAVPECLKDATFVFTGILENLNRDRATDMVKELGGRVTTAVSSKTNYLVVGDVLEDGRPYSEGSKYRKAQTIPSIHMVHGEKKLFGLFKLYQDRAKKEQGVEDSKPTVASEDKSRSTPAKAETPAKMAPSGTPSQKRPVLSNPYARRTSPGSAVNPYAKTTAAPSNPYAKKAVNPYAKATSSPSGAQKVANPYQKGAQTVEAPAKTEPKSASGGGDQLLWVDKYAPKQTFEILGNKENITKLTNWLRTWERTFNNPKAIGKSFSNPRGPLKAALLSGPPGIGKTTTATLVAKEAGRDLLEFNASDARSKKALQTTLGDITGSQAINFGQSNTKRPSNKLRCIIMDEVDGMGAGDRSGMAELIQMIKKSRVPIICICNDRQSQKVKSLVPYCMDLRFRRPVKSVMANRILRIAKQEGMTVERNAAEAMAESCGNDVRQVVNLLQMWANKKGNSKRITYKKLKERENDVNKDEILRVSLFDAAKLILEGRKNLNGADPKQERDSFFRRSDAFFVDYSMTGLLVQQNYLKVMNVGFAGVKAAKDPTSEEAFLEDVYKASLCMSDYDLAESAIRGGDQNWSLLPFAGAMAVKTGYHAGGEKGGALPSFPEFTSWMGKNSSKGRKLRLLEELQYHMNYKISGGTLEIRKSYLPLLRERLIKDLISDEGSTENAIALMDEYGLSRDDVMDKFDEFRLGSSVPAFADMDSKAKAAFTREYNQGSHKSQALVAAQGGGNQRSRKGKAAVEKDPADLDAIDEEAVEEESDNDEEEDMKKLQEKFRKKGSKGRGKGQKTKRSKK